MPRRPLNPIAHLEPDDQRELDALVKRHGHAGAAKTLGVTPTFVERFAHGGYGAVESAQRMREALHRRSPL